MVQTFGSSRAVVLDVFRAVLEPVLDGLCGGHSLEVSVDVDADAS